LISPHVIRRLFVRFSVASDFCACPSPCSATDPYYIPPPSRYDSRPLFRQSPSFSPSPPPVQFSSVFGHPGFPLCSPPSRIFLSSGPRRSGSFIPLSLTLRKRSLVVALNFLALFEGGYSFFALSLARACGRAIASSLLKTPFQVFVPLRLFFPPFSSSAPPVPSARSAPITVSFLKRIPPPHGTFDVLSS